MVSKLFFCQLEDTNNNGVLLQNKFGHSVVLLRSNDFASLCAHGFRVVVVEYDDNPFYQVNAKFYNSRCRKARATALDFIYYRSFKNNYKL
jgi:hypothetical protein